MMDLTKLFETQKILRDRINYNEPDRFNKLVLALLVELGECANEVRCFKFWSHKPASEKKVILEEFVDGLHFILELGIEKEYEYENHRTKVKHNTITEQFNKLFQKAGDFSQYRTLANYMWIIDLYVGLGEMLGFTWEEVEQSYYEKNKINHQRQDSGVY
jgi:dimeric dUTPase (all-alpha-NTP-PPase superfamily)